MRIEVYAPSGDGIEPVRDALALVGVSLPVAALEPFTRYELLLAYDWAWRTHLRASDAVVRMRLKPAFLDLLEEEQKARRLAEWPVMTENLAGVPALMCGAMRREEDGALRPCTFVLSPRGAAMRFPAAKAIAGHAARVPHEGD